MKVPEQVSSCMLTVPMNVGQSSGFAARWGNCLEQTGIIMVLVSRSLVEGRVGGMAADHCLFVEAAIL